MLAVNRRMAVLVVVLTLTAALAACTPAAAPTPTPTKAPAAAATVPAAAPTKAAEPTKPPPPPATATPKPVTLKFGTTGAINYAGIYLGMEKGFFKEQGIDIELVEFRTSSDSIPALATGQLDLISTPLGASILAAVDRGIELKLVADAGQGQQGWQTFWTVLRKDLADSGRVKTPADLKGMKLAIPSLASSGEMMAQQMMAEGRLKKEDVELVVLPHADQVVALANKAIDAGVTVEPYIATGVQQGVSVKWIPKFKYYPSGKYQGSFFAFGPQLIKNKDVAQRWMLGYLKGVRAYLDAFSKKTGRDEVISILAKYTPIKDPKLYDLMELPYLDPNGLPDKPSMDIELQWYLDQGLYKGKTTFDAITDLSYAEYASQKLGRQ